MWYIKIMVLPFIFLGMILVSIFSGSYILGSRQAIYQPDLYANEQVVTATPNQRVLSSPTFIPTNIPLPTSIRTEPTITTSARPTSRPTSPPPGAENWQNVIRMIQRAFINKVFDELRGILDANVQHIILSTGCCEETGIESAIAFISGKVNAGNALWTFDESNPTINRIKESDPTYEYYYIGLASDGQVFLFNFNIQQKITDVVYTQHYRLITGSD